MTKIVKFKKVIPLIYDKPKPEVETEAEKVAPPAAASNENSQEASGNDEQIQDEIIESATQGT